MTALPDSILETFNAAPRGRTLADYFRLRTLDEAVKHATQIIEADDWLHDFLVSETDTAIAGCTTSVIERGEEWWSYYCALRKTILQRVGM